MIRDATLDDIPELLRMGREFYNVSGYSDLGEYNPDLLIKTIEILINSGTLLITDGGMIGWLNFPLYMTGDIVSQELFWWVDEEKRSTGISKKLLKCAEEKSKEQGAKAMMMLCLDRLDGDRVGKMYEHFGYTPRETTYMRLH